MVGAQIKRNISRKLLSLLTVGGLLATMFSCTGRRDNTPVDPEMQSQWEDAVREYGDVPKQAKKPVASVTATHGDGGAKVDVTKSEKLVNSPYTVEYRSVYDAPLQEVFNDSNKYQYAYAEAFGIRPITNLGMAYFISKPVVKIASCDAYYVEALTHSMPYLVPKAADLLREIGERFTKKAKAKTGGDYKIKVTSLLRTPLTVKKLKRVNVNATDSSTHQFATTFDISYNFFLDRRTGTVTDRAGLKEALAEVLFELRRDNRCMVKYERKTPCFHVTVAK